MALEATPHLVGLLQHSRYCNGPCLMLGVIHNHSGILFFSIVVRLVALVQVSSASVECIFSQLELSCETTGDNPLEETLICRVLQRCNDYSVDK